MTDLTGKKITMTDGTKVKVGAAIQSGGQGQCYHATNLNTRERLILKVFTTATHDEFEAVRRRCEFLVAERLFELSPLFDCAPRAFFASRRLGVGHIAKVAPGESLDALIERGWSADLLQLTQLALALAHAMTQLHERGFVHGDVQGGNLFIQECGSVLKLYLIDFDNFGHADQPAPQPCIGQELFLAPEIRKARRVGTYLAVDEPAERFMLTAMMHLLLLLRHPGHAAAEDPDKFDAVICSGRWADDPARTSSVPGGYPSQVLNVALQNLIRRGLSSAPAERPSAKEWESALAEAVENVFIHETCGGPIIIDRTKTVCPHCASGYPGIALSILPHGPVLPVAAGGIRLGRANLGGNQAISNHHANIERFGPEYRLTSFGTNGTYRATPNGWLRLPQGVPVLIQPGDKLCFADVVETLVITSEAAYARR